MLFGWKKVSAKVHYFSTICVAAGAHFSAVWIVVANSWMQTPAGFKIVGSGVKARAVVTDFWAMMFNPSSVDRLTHVILGCWLTGLVSRRATPRWHRLPNVPYDDLYVGPYGHRRFFWYILVMEKQAKWEKMVPPFLGIFCWLSTNCEYGGLDDC